MSFFLPFFLNFLCLGDDLFFPSVIIGIESVSVKPEFTGV